MEEDARFVSIFSSEDGKASEDREREKQREALAARYEHTLRTHSRFYDDSSSSDGNIGGRATRLAWQRAAILLLIVVMVYYALRGRLEVGRGMEEIERQRGQEDITWL